jgi:hypothetical protein
MAAKNQEKKGTRRPHETTTSDKTSQIDYLPGASFQHKQELVHVNVTNAARHQEIFPRDQVSDLMR